MLPLVVLLAGCRSEKQDHEGVASTAGTPTAVPARAAPKPGEPSPARELTWSFESTAVGPMSVVVSVPAHAATQKFPVLIALHGRGEAF
ncbi:MAG TPA: hypothetical protein VFU02_06555, partial [Polyangiaceae bacterium]|nr:hypothetical protein [Polyangiaceae bacterium]